MNELELYKKWNDAFYDFYFGNNQDNVVLYVDNEIINRIGHEIDPEDEDPIESFFYTVLMGREERGSFAEQFNRNTGVFLVVDDVKRNNIFYLAQELAEKSNNPRNQYLRLPCLNYLVFIIYAFQYGLEDERAERPQWSQVSDVINYFLEETISTTDRSTTVELLFQAVSRNQANFDSNLKSGEQPYVGRIKYQFVLNNAERRLLYDIMDSHQLRWDEDRIGYAEFANRNILPYLNGNRYSSLREKIIDPNNNVFFRNIISQFDPQTHHTEEVVDRIIHGTILYIYSLEKKCFSIGLDMNIETDVTIGDLSFSPGREFYGLFLSDVQEVDNIESCHIETTEMDIRTIDGDVLYFALKGMYYIQCSADDLIDGCSYLVVSNNERSLQNILQRQHNYRLIALQGFNYTQMYFVPSWSIQARARAQRIVKEQQYSFGFGIKNPSKPNSYYPEGVPSIVVSNDVIDDVRYIKVICKQVGIQDRLFEICNFKQYGGNELFYRLPNDLLAITDPYKLEVYIVKFDNTDYLVGVINIQPCHLDNYARSSYVFDKWNRTLHETPEQGSYYQNNKVYRAEERDHLRRYVILQSVSQEPREDMMMLANILFVVFNQEEEISDKKFNNIIKYVGGYFNFDAGDYRIKNSLKHSLLSLGFVSRSYSNGYLYRPNNTRVVRTNRNIRNANQRVRQNVCLLYGTYSIHEIEMIRDAGCCIHYRWPYMSSELENRPYLKCLPDLVLIEDYNSDNVGINYVDYPLADDLIDYIGNMRDFEAVFLPREGHHREDIETIRIPYYKKEDNRTILVTNRGTYRDYEFENARGNLQFFRLPEALVKLYCQNMHNQPVCLVKAPQRNGYEDFSLFFERYSMGMPRLLQKALCELNLGIPSLTYVFPIDRFISGGILYSQLYKYNVETIIDNQNSVRDLKKVIVEKLSGHHVENLYQDNSVSVVRSLSNYKMMLFEFQNGDGNNIYSSLVLYYTYRLQREKVIAFSIEETDNVYRVYGTNQNYGDDITDYYEIIDNDINHAFSAMIRNRNVTYGQRYNGEIPTEHRSDLKSSREVKIMEESNNN